MKQRTHDSLSSNTYNQSSSLESSEWRLTARGRRVKTALTAATGVIAATIVAGGAYEAAGPKEVVVQKSFNLGQESPEGDISLIEDAVEDLGYTPSKVNGVVSEGQSVRKEAERAGTDAGTITIYKTPILGDKLVDISFKSESDTN